MGLEEPGGCTGYPFPGEALYVAEGGRSCMSLILGSEELYVGIPVCSCLRRSSALASMLRLKLYPPPPVLHGV